MIFNSYIFLFVFFPIAWLGFWMLRGKQPRYIWLTLASYIFYGYWDWRFTALLLVSTIIDFYVARQIPKHEGKKKKMVLLISLAANLGMLGFFKYFNFSIDSLQSLFTLFQLSPTLPNLDIILPVGISFFTFQTMSYTIDVYRGKLKPTKNFMEFACYVSLFPQLVAGPIVRFSDIDSDLENIDQHGRTQSFHRGGSMFLVGLAKKVIIADTIAHFINPLFANTGDLYALTAWVAIIGYTLQLYFDFSGYSDMALGLGLLFGLKFPQNFHSPYKAVDIQDFWRRWHMSLSAWLKDYLYIPLGGSRKGTVRTFINMMLTMLLGGLWHGASWNFVVWGGIHGTLLGVTKIIKPWHDKLNYWFRRFLTLFLVMISWVFFRNITFGDSTNMLRAMFSFDNWTMPAAWNLESQIILFGMLFVGALIALFAPNSFEIKYSTKKSVAILLAFLFVVSLILMNYTQQVFLYYQF